MEPAIVGALIGASAAIAATLTAQLMADRLSRRRDSNDRRAARVTAVVEAIAVDLYRLEDAGGRRDDAAVAEARQRVAFNAEVLRVYWGSHDPLVAALESLPAMMFELGAVAHNFGEGGVKAERRTAGATIFEHRDPWIEDALNRAEVDHPRIERRKLPRRSLRLRMQFIASGGSRGRSS